MRIMRGIGVSEYAKLQLQHVKLISIFKLAFILEFLYRPKNSNRAVLKLDNMPLFKCNNFQFYWPNYCWYQSFLLCFMHRSLQIYECTVLKFSHLPCLGRILVSGDTAWERFSIRCNFSLLKTLSAITTKAATIKLYQLSNAIK